MINQSFSLPTAFRLKQLARQAGWCYLLLIVCGLFSEGLVREQLIVQGDATITAKQIMEKELLFRWGIGADLIMIVCDVLMAWFMFWLLRPVNRYVSQLAALFRLTQAAILGMNVLNYFGVLFLLNQPAYLNGFTLHQLESGALWLINMHTYGYLISGVFFGVSCLLTGYLIKKSGYIPEVIGLLVMIAGVGYLFDSFTHFIYPRYNEISEQFVVITAVVGELSLCFWLLVKGIRLPK